MANIEVATLPVPRLDVLLLRAELVGGYRSAFAGRLVRRRAPGR